MFKIESSDFFLCLGLELILEQIHVEHEICIVDLASFNFLSDLLGCINRHPHCHNFIFIGDGKLYSQILSTLIYIRRDIGISELIKKLKKPTFISCEHARLLLNTIKSMGNLTRTEKHTVYSLLKNNSLSSAAFFTGSTKKQFYQRVRAISKKFYIKNSLHLHNFVRREYKINDVNVNI